MLFETVVSEKQAATTAQTFRQRDNATSAEQAETLYPALPCLEKNGQSYRLQEISQLKKRLEDEKDKRAELYEKYH